MKILLLILLILNGLDSNAISVKFRIITKHSGRGISTAIVRLNVSGEDKVTKGGISDDNGLCRIDSLPAGIYDIKTSMIGYPAVYLKNVAIESDTIFVIELDNK